MGNTPTVAMMGRQESRTISITAKAGPHRPGSLAVVVVVGAFGGSSVALAWGAVFALLEGLLVPHAAHTSASALFSE
jgi:hypothetical protein